MASKEGAFCYNSSLTTTSRYIIGAIAGPHRSFLPTERHVDPKAITYGCLSIGLEPSIFSCCYLFGSLFHICMKIPQACPFESVYLSHAYTRGILGFNDTKDRLFVTDNYVIFASKMQIQRSLKHLPLLLLTCLAPSINLGHDEICN